MFLTPRKSLLADFDELFNSFSSSLTPLNNSSVAVSNDENILTLSLDVPGMTKDDLNIELEAGTITISGKTEVLGQKREVYRRFTIPTETNLEEITATVENGLLLLSLPKLSSAHKKHILIT